MSDLTEELQDNIKWTALTMYRGTRSITYFSDLSLVVTLLNR